MSTPAHWSACQAPLESLFELTERSVAAAREAVASGHAEAFAASCAQLAQHLATATPRLHQTLAEHGQPPVELAALMARIQANLDSLQEHIARQQAATKQTLGVLLPADPLKEYSRLGGKLGGYGAQPRPGSGYLKA